MFLNNIQLALMLGWQDVRQTYRRSPIGPFWVTITTGVLITTMGFVFGLLFKIPYQDYLPYLAIGILTWNLMSSIISDASNLFLGSADLVRQIKLPVYVYVLRLVWRAFIIFLHNIVILPILFLALQVPVSWAILLSLPGFLLVVANLTWVVVALGIVATRYRDFNQLTVSFLNVLFYLTPVMWKKDGIESPAVNFILYYNPFSMYLSLIRDPLLGGVPTFRTWAFAGATALVGWGFALLIARRYASRVVYWL